MADIENVGKIATEFLERMLGVSGVRVIAAVKADNMWEVQAEVFEESSFLKSLGLPSRIKDKNLYRVKLNAALEVESYERQGLALQTT